MRPRVKLAEFKLVDLLALADPPNESGCRLWQMARVQRTAGYGRITVGGREHRAHRLSWMLANGCVIPEGMVVMHGCDVAACVEPSHLTIGTPADNNRDMLQKGRIARGERHGSAKLSNAQVDEIRVLYRTGLRQVDLADRFGVAQVSISRIVRGTAYRVTGGVAV